MKILITGGAGYIGSHTAKALAETGIEPVVFDNLSHGHEWAVRWGRLLKADLSDRAALRSALRDVDGVIHFAASIFVGESMTQPGAYFRNNTANALNLLEAIAESGVRPIVFSSTAAVYGEPQSNLIAEDHPHRPLNPYGESKLMVERMLHWFGEAHGLPWAALRYFNAAGADASAEIGEDHHPENHLIPLVIDAALGRRSHVSVFGNDYPSPDGTAIRDYIHVTDLASAHLRALRRLLNGTPSLTLNLGTGLGSTVREVIKVVQQVSRRNVPVQDCPRRPGDSPVLVANASRAHLELDWTPAHSSLRNIVETAWRWHSRTRTA